MRIEDGNFPFAQQSGVKELPGGLFKRGLEEHHRSRALIEEVISAQSTQASVHTPTAKTDNGSKDHQHCWELMESQKTKAMYEKHR